MNRYKNIKLTYVFVKKTKNVQDLIGGFQMMSQRAKIFGYFCQLMVLYFLDFQTTVLKIGGSIVLLEMIFTYRIIVAIFKKSTITIFLRKLSLIAELTIVDTFYLSFLNFAKTNTDFLQFGHILKLNEN